MSLPVGLLSRLALRNVRRNARRSLLTALAMVIGLALLVFSRAIGDGAHEDWIASGVRLGSGHVVIERVAFRRSGDLADRMDAAAAGAARAALDDPALAARIVAVAPRLTVTALASAATAAVPVRIVAGEPDTERRFSVLADKLIAGRVPAADDVRGALVGDRFARRLDLSPGSRFVVSAQDAEGQITDQLLRVAGIFRTGLPDADEGLVQMPLATARRWLHAGDALTEIGVLLHSSRQTAAVAGVLQGVLAGRPDSVTALGWREAMPALDAAVRMDDYGSYLMHGILFAIIALAIVNTMLMSLLNRSREFGILRALGLTRAQTAGIVFLEGLLLTAISGVVGLVLGAAVTWGLFRDGLDFSSLMKGDTTMSGAVISPVIIPELGAPQLLLSAAFIVAVGVLAALYPAWRATRLDPVDAMKFEA